MEKTPRKYNILMISSCPPKHSAGLAQTKIDALVEAGHSVDFMTAYDYPGKGDNVITLMPAPVPPPMSWKRKYVIRPVRLVARVCGMYALLKKIKSIADSGHKPKGNGCFLHPDEKNPPVSPQLIVDNIRKKYDAVITLFWEGMLNSTSLKAIYDKLHCPILICSPDMAPMTGGCYYFGHCRNFYESCGKCVALGSSDPDDQSHINHVTKKENYSAINCAFLGNTWMNRFAEKSGLFKNIFLSEIIINEDKFREGDVPAVRRDLNIGDNKRFVILIASSAAPRKGNDDIAKALCLFYDRLSDSERNQVEILVIGDDYLEKSLKKTPVRIHFIGRVDTANLIKCYQAADIFINASLDDAGPSMVNQSIMCGTPVVCYDNGTAVDVIENNVSGYKAATGDVEGLADAIGCAYNLDCEAYAKLRVSTRKMAIEHNSVSRHIRNIIDYIGRLEETAGR